jgi:O-antigen ligase
MKEIATPQVILIKPPPEAPPPEAPIPEAPTIVSTLSGRTVGVWPQSWKLFLESPLIGWGFHADRIFLNKHSHNAILQALVQTGVIGTFFFISAFIWTFMILFRLLKKTEILEKEKPFLIGIAGVLVFFMLRSITESTGAFFGADWLILAPILAYLQQLNQKYG